MNLGELNLNHLVSLDALLRERHVGQAAIRMGVTQSAMSHTLRALRGMLDDPLLVRVGNTMQLTPYAEQAQVKLQRGLADLESVVSRRAAFDPAKVTGRFTVASHDGTAPEITTYLHTELRTLAPEATLRVMPIDERTLEDQLGDGDIDVAVIPPFVGHEGMHAIPTGTVGVSVVCRKGHPEVKKRMSLAKYASASHAVLSLSGDGTSMIDVLLKKKSMKRHVAVLTPYVLSLGEVLAKSDLIATVPTPLAEFLCERWPLVTYPFPLSDQRAGLLLCYHPRFEADPQHVFFRGLVRDAIDSMARGIESYRPPKRPR